MSQLLLAVDTSGKNGSIALARVTPGQSDVEIVEIVPLAGGAFSAQLVQQIAALLESHGHSKSDLSAFAVASGPGSFTGLRVGLAAIKALGEALQKPIVAVSLLEAVACGSTIDCGSTVQSNAVSIAVPARVLAVLDAGRGDVYVGDYDVHPQLHMPQLHMHKAHMRSERLLSAGEFLKEASGFEAARNAAVAMTPDTVLAEKARAAGIHVQLIEYPNAGLIARLGWEHLQRGETIRPEDLEANYIRHSDAEIFARPKA